MQNIELKASDITDITITKRDYHWDNGFNRFELDCLINGEKEHYIYEMSRHDNGYGAGIYTSDNKSIFDNGKYNMSISEFNNLINNIEQAVNLEEYRNKISSCKNMEELDYERYGFMEDENNYTYKNKDAINELFFSKKIKFITEQIETLEKAKFNANLEGKSYLSNTIENKLLETYDLYEPDLLAQDNVCGIFHLKESLQELYDVCVFENSINGLIKGEVIDDAFDIIKTQYNLTNVVQIEDRTLSDIANEFGKPRDIISVNKDGSLKSYFIEENRIAELPNFNFEIELQKESQSMEFKLKYDQITHKCFNSITDADNLELNSFEVLDESKTKINQILKDAYLSNEVEITHISIDGSRSRGMEKPMNESDLDILVEYKGTIREDALFNLLNESNFKIGNVKVDFNPINNEYETIGEYLIKEEIYHVNKITKALEEGVPIAITEHYLDKKDNLILFNEEIDNIMLGQLEGYGYSADSCFDQLVKVDISYSNNKQILIEAATPESLLEDAIEYRTELMDEKYGERSNYDVNDLAVKELYKMEEFKKSLTKENIKEKPIFTKESMKEDLIDKKASEKDSFTKPAHEKSKVESL